HRVGGGDAADACADRGEGPLARRSDPPLQARLADLGRGMSHLPSAKSPPRDLRGRTFVGRGGRRYAALWFSKSMAAAAAALAAAECEVASMLVAGWSNEAIAKARRVSRSTVANQARSIYTKLGVSSRAELASRRDPL